MTDDQVMDYKKYIDYETKRQADLQRQLNELYGDKITFDESPTKSSLDMRRESFETSREELFTLRSRIKRM